VVLALLGVSAYSVATQDERIAGNARDHARAMDAAETMLRACEHYIVQNPLVFDNGVQGFLPSPVNHTWFALDTVNNPTPWASGNTVALSKVFTWPNGAAAPDWMATPPQCIAEAVPVCQINCSKTAGALYEAHVAAQGYGLNTSTVVTLESYVAFYK
jgi:Tfp pilus assembly protein PilX